MLCLTVPLQFRPLAPRFAPLPMQFHALALRLPALALGLDALPLRLPALALSVDARRRGRASRLAVLCPRLPPDTHPLSSLPGLLKGLATLLRAKACVLSLAAHAPMLPFGLELPGVPNLFFGVPFLPFGVKALPGGVEILVLGIPVLPARSPGAPARHRPRRRKVRRYRGLPFGSHRRISFRTYEAEHLPVPYHCLTIPVQP